MSDSSHRSSSFLADCQARARRNRVRETIRDQGADVLLTLFRLVKNAFVHTADNQAVVTAAAEAARALRTFGARVGSDVTLTFVDGVVFVCGELVRGTRRVFETAAQLGTLFESCGVAEILVSAEVTSGELRTFADAFSTAHQRREPLLDVGLDSIQLRPDQRLFGRREGPRELPEMEEALRLYASALVVLRRFCDNVASESSFHLHRVKRIAQRLVSLAERSELALLAMTTLANAHRDDAGRALQTAIIAIMMGRQVTTDRALLAQLALAALISDIGRLQLAGSEMRDRLVPLSDSTEAAIPAHSAVLCITAGGVSLQSALRTVLVYESNWIARRELLGPLPGSASGPLLFTRILHTARTLLERLAPRDTSVPVSPAIALAALAEAPGIDPDVYRLLMNALGVIPVGTVVWLNNGALGVVTGPSSNRQAPDRPRVRVLMDLTGQLIARPTEIDLGVMDPTEPDFGLASIVEPGKDTFNVSAVVIEAVAQRKAAG